MSLTTKEFDVLQPPMFYKGVIEDNADPKGYGRIRVRVLGLHSDNKSDVPTSTLPWANISRSLDFGGLKNGVGISSIPQIGTYVYLFFELNDYSKPVVIGSIAGFDNNQQSLSSDYLNVHTIKTPSNHIIRINDNTNEITIIHSIGSKIQIAPDGSIIIDSKANINVTSSGATNVTSTGDMTLKGSSVTIQSASNTLVI